MEFNLNSFELNLFYFFFFKCFAAIFFFLFKRSILAIKEKADIMYVTLYDIFL